jgi:hypothetical protein
MQDTSGVQRNAFVVKQMNSLIMNKQINQHTIKLMFFLNIQEQLRVLYRQKLRKYTKSPMPGEILSNVFKCMVLVYIVLSRQNTCHVSRDTPLLCTVHTT